jgi:hypothetical protein
MSITREHCQERLSFAYINAVAAKAGYTCTRPELDYGMDLQIKTVEYEDGFLQDTGFALDVSAKATHNFVLLNGDIHYKLDVKAYNSLVKPRMIPAVLVLYCMPDDDALWLSVQEDETTLKHCGYWLSLRGQQPTDNTGSKVVNIPKKQMFREESLKQIMDKVKRGEYL